MNFVINASKKENYIEKSIDRFITYLRPDRHCFMYPQIPRVSIIQNNRYSIPQAYAISVTDSINQEIKRYATKEYYNKEIPLDKYSRYFNIIRNENNDMENEFSNYTIQPKNFFAMAALFSIHFATPIYASDLWILLSFALFVYAIILLFKSKFKNKIAWIIFTLGCIHFLSLIVISFAHNNLVYRYETVTAFIIYILPAFIPILFDIKFSIKLKSNETPMRKDFSHKGA